MKAEGVVAVPVAGSSAWPPQQLLVASMSDEEDAETRRMRLCFHTDESPFGSLSLADSLQILAALRYFLMATCTMHGARSTGGISSGKVFQADRWESIKARAR